MGIVIKAGHFHVPTSGMYSLDLRDISQQAAGMLEAARMEAQRILQQARTAAEAERQHTLQVAHRKGYEEGLEAGKAAGQAAALDEARTQFAAERGQAASTLVQMVEAFKASRERLYIESRRDVLVLAVAIASRIVHQLTQVEELATSAAESACREALEIIGESTEVVVRSHPEDKIVLERFCEDLAQSLNSSRHVRLLDDPAVGRGGVIVETTESTVDASAASRVAMIADEVVAGFQKRMQMLGLMEQGAEARKQGTAYREQE